MNTYIAPTPSHTPYHNTSITDPLQVNNQIFPFISLKKYENTIASIHLSESIAGQPRNLRGFNSELFHKYDPSHNGAHSAYFSLPLL